MTGTRSAPSAQPIPKLFLGGLFLVCMSVLMLQILQTRLLSVMAWYYLAFFAISMAMFGLTFGALLVYFNARRFPPDRLLDQLSWLSAAFGVTVVLSAIATATATIASGFGGALTVILWLKLILVMVPPYILGGMVISLALTRSPWPVGIVYGVDLLGAATGCLLVLALMSLMDGVSALLATGAFGALAATCFRAAWRRSGNPAAGTTWSDSAPLLREPILLAVLLASFSVLNAVEQPGGIGPVVVKNVIQSDPPAAQAWNSFSRIRAEMPVVGPASLWGQSPRMPPRQTEELRLTIDGSAGTAMYHFNGDLKSLDFLAYDLTNLAYHIRNHGRSAVAGVGGGRDLLSAHLFGFDDVTGVELNPIFIDWLTHRFRTYTPLADIAGTRLLVDDARSWFARTNERFDLIEMSLVDTWAATGAGAFSLSENGLYTVQGWRHFLHALTPTGVFTVSRWYDPHQPLEIGRVVALASAALRAEGNADFRAHIYVATVGNLATIIVGRAAFTPADLTQLHDATQKLGFVELLSPDHPGSTTVLDRVLAATDASADRALAYSVHADLSAPTDDRPFFFNQLLLTDLASLRQASAAQAGVAHGNLEAMKTIGIIVVLSFVLVFGAMVVPSLPSLRRTTRQVAALGTGYFCLIGLGFMFIELGIIQRVSIFLGHPVFGLAIGLCGMILSTGIGSLISHYFRLDTPNRVIAWIAALALFVAASILLFPVVAQQFEGSGIALRALVALGAIVPAGIMMGFGFPTGMALIESIDASPTPWFWAVNGAAGVLASGVAVGTSIAFSISSTLWIGNLCYVLMLPVALALLRLRGGDKEVVLF